MEGNVARMPHSTILSFSPSKCSVSDTRQSCKLGDCIVLRVSGHTAVQHRVSLRAVPAQLLSSSGLDDEIFLVEESGVKSALFSSLSVFSKG